jgi:hypothetical protein
VAVQSIRLGALQMFARMLIKSRICESRADLVMKVWPIFSSFQQTFPILKRETLRLSCFLVRLSKPNRSAVNRNGNEKSIFGHLCSLLSELLARDFFAYFCANEHRLRFLDSERCSRSQMDAVRKRAYTMVTRHRPLVASALDAVRHWSWLVLHIIRKHFPIWKPKSPQKGLGYFEKFSGYGRYNHLTAFFK